VYDHGEDDCGVAMTEAERTNLTVGVAVAKNTRRGVVGKARV
jgi:hypothetical protein